MPEQLTSRTEAEIEFDCRQFAIASPTPNVLKAVGHAERGEISWLDCYGLFRKAIDETAATACELDASPIRECVICGEFEGTEWVTRKCLFEKDSK